MSSKNESSSFIELLQLANEVPRVKPLSFRPPPDKTKTFAQKRKITAISKNKARIKDLEQDLQALILSKRKYISNDRDNDLPPELLLKITKVKRALAQCKSRVIEYAGCKIVYQAGTIRCETLHRDEYNFWRYLIDREYSSYKQFSNANGELIMVDKFGNRYHEARQRTFRRLTYLHTYVERMAEVYLSAQDGRWLIAHWQNIINRIGRESSMNTYLAKERAEHLTNPDYRHEAKGSKENRKYHYYDLEEITSPRPFERLMKCYGMQMRLDERMILSKVALSLKSQFSAIFVQKDCVRMP